MPRKANRLEWRISATYTAKYTEGLPALILVGPSDQFPEEVWVVCSYRPKDVFSMNDALEKAVATTKEYLAQGYTVIAEQIDLKAMMAV